jgi:hypothetical protein
MATLQAPLRIYPNSTWSLQQRYIGAFNTGSGSPTYIHIKTNLSTGGDVMYMFEAVGYNYGNGNSVRCAWGLYAYQNVLYHTGVQTAYGGLSADGIYVSSDNYVCLRGYMNSHYYQGFIINAYPTRTDTTHYNVSITAISQNSTSGNYY